MNIIDVIIGSVIIALLVFSSTAVFGVVKDYLVDAENYYEANKFSTQTLEELRVVPYSDPALIENTVLYPAYPRPLDDCRLKDIAGGDRSYVVTNRYWDPPANLYQYKEIVVTTTWAYKGQVKSVSFGTVRRDDG